MTSDATPSNVPLSDQLGSLPAPAVHWPQNLPLHGGGEVTAATYYTADHMREYAERAVAAEREPGNVVFRALLLAAFSAPETRTAGEMRAAAVTLFGESAVEAALARIGS